MKSSILIAIGVFLTLSSQLVTAGTIADTYTTGDILTAAKMDNIKTAVNDNDTNINAQFSGDGSAGDLTISAATNWNTTPPTNPYFDNITINAGQTLTVPAGTTIRCAGSFTNNGTIQVLTGATNTGTNWGASSPVSSGPKDYAHPGDSFGPAIMGLFDDDSIVDPITINGGAGGKGVPQAFAVTSFSQFRIGGGSGVGGNGSVKGGGLLKVYCAGGITNNGAINADGSNGSSSTSGAGGGIVVLASIGLVDNTSGTISVIGGNGGSQGTVFGAGGGGGGGIIILMSSTAPIAGATNVTGGTGTVGASTQASKGRLAGSGGGASGGNGGAGGSVSSTGANNSGSNGLDGYVISTTANPVFMAR